MQKKDLIIAVGVIVVLILLLRLKNNKPKAVIKPGDKGPEVYGLQSVLTSVTGLKFPDEGAYDNWTLKAVQYYLQDTKALIDYDKGYVDKDFAFDLFLIQNKIKKS